MLQWTMVYMCLFQFWFPQCRCLGVESLGHMVVFKGISILSSIAAVSIYIPPPVQEHSLFSTPCPAFIVFRFYDDGHSDWCEVISHCSFDLHFCNNKCWAFSHVFINHLCLWKTVCLGFLCIFWLGCLFFWYWTAWATCLFWRLILCQLFHLILFSPTLRVVFSSCSWFALQKLLSLIRFHLFIFAFISITLGVGSLL